MTTKAYEQEHLINNWENSRIKGAQFSDRSIVQIYFHDFFRKERYRNAAWLRCFDYWVVDEDEQGPPYGEWHDMESQRFTFIQAQASDLLSKGGTQNVDPTLLKKSSALEDAVQNLVEDFHSFNGAGSEELFQFNTEVSIRDKDETIP